MTNDKHEPNRPQRDAMPSTGHPVVDAVGEMKLTGNLIPKAWYRTILNTSGQPDHLAITILSEIVYWYRPSIVRDSETRALIAKKRFKADALQLNRGKLEEMFNTGKRNISRAFKRLEELAVISREQRTIRMQGRVLNNVLYIHLHPERLAALSTLPETDVSTPTDKNDNTSGQIRQQPTPQMSTGAEPAVNGCCVPDKTITEIGTQSITEKTKTITTKTSPDGDVRSTSSWLCFGSLTEKRTRT